MASYFRFHDLFDDAFSIETIERRMVGRLMVKWKGFGRGLFWVVSRNLCAGTEECPGRDSNRARNPDTTS
jgi:hypothetical protein